RRLLEQITGSARAERIEDALIIVVDGERYQQRLWAQLFQQPDAFDAAHPRQSDIYERYVRRGGVDFRRRFFHRAETADAAKAIGAVEQRGQILAEFA